MRASVAYLYRLAFHCAWLALLAGPAAAGAHAPTLDTALDALVAQLVDADAQEVPGTRTSRPVAVGDRHVLLSTVDISGFAGGHRGGTLLVVHESTDIGDRSQGSALSPAVRLVAFAWVAGRGWRQLEARALRVDAGQIVMPGLAYLPGDPSCCPSQQIEARYSLVNDNLVAH